MASRSQQRGGLTQTTSEQIGELIANLGDQLERLRVLYEQYFIGIEKREPTIIRSKVERGIRELSRTYIRNTALRFRFNTLKQKLQVYRIHWGRTIRQIEAGTWRRSRRRGAEEIENVSAAVKMARKRRQRRLTNLAKLRGEPVPTFDELPDFAEDVSFDTGEQSALTGEDVSFESPEDASFDSVEDVSFDSFNPNGGAAPGDDEMDRGALPDLPLVGEDEVGGVGDALDDAFARMTDTSADGNGVAPDSPAPVAAFKDVPTTPAATPQQSQVAPETPPEPPVTPVSPPKPPAAAAAKRRAKRPRTVPPPVPKAPPRPKPKPKRRFEGVYADYIKQRKANGESTAVPYEKLERILKQQESSLRNKKKWRDVSFRVAEENGKTVVKAARARPSEVKPKA